MEIIDTHKLERYDSSATVKEVPLLTDQLVASLLFTTVGNATPMHSNGSSDEIHVVLRGSGRVRVGGESRQVAEGNVVLVPRGTRYSYTASQDDLALLLVAILKDCIERAPAPPPTGEGTGTG